MLIFLYLTQFFLEWEMFQTKVVENFNKHFIFRNVFRKSRLLWDNVEKYYVAGQIADDDMSHTNCMLDN